MQYYSLNRYLQQTFGQKIYKLSLNAGMTCPNRDGKISTGGCIFCSQGGSGEFATNPCLSITEQIEQAKVRVSQKIKNGKYIAYFQAYTNTYAPVNYLREIFTEAINHPDIVAISIGTRPDCLPKEVLNLLAELNQIKPVWVELGLQTIHKESAVFINRGYDLPVYDSAVQKLKSININVITHLILGLPNETVAQMVQSVEYVSRVTDGIKLQLLHILKGTKLEQLYNNGEFRVLSMAEYIDILRQCLAVLPPNVVVHRLTGDGDKKLLVAPLWSADKKRVLNAINQMLSNN